MDPFCPVCRGVFGCPLCEPEGPGRAIAEGVAEGIERTTTADEAIAAAEDMAQKALEHAKP